jgi:hypothetical protein
VPQPTNTVADIIASSLDGDFHDGEGIFFDATSSGNTVSLTLTDVETDVAAKYTVTITLQEEAK